MAKPLVGCFQDTAVIGACSSIKRDTVKRVRIWDNLGSRNMCEFTHLQCLPGLAWLANSYYPMRPPRPAISAPEKVYFQVLGACIWRVLLRKAILHMNQASNCSFSCPSVTRNYKGCGSEYMRRASGDASSPSSSPENVDVQPAATQKGHHT